MTPLELINAELERLHHTLEHTNICLNGNFMGTVVDCIKDLNRQVIAYAEDELGDGDE
jgi:hypothetical protein